MPFHLANKAILAFVLAISLVSVAGDREPAPRFSAKTLAGERLTNDSLKGKVVLLQFWTTWCPYCRRDQPSVESINHDYAEDGLVILAVDVGESKKTVRKYLEQNPRSCKIVLNDDTNLPAMFETKAFPLYVLIDREGNVAGIQHGAAGEDALRPLLRRAGLGADEQ